MNIMSVRHRGLRRLLQNDDQGGLRQDLVPRVRRILVAIVSAVDMEGVKGPPGWRVHPISGNRAGTWSISVSGNWRITFTLIGDEVHDRDLEDYH